MPIPSALPVTVLIVADDALGHNTLTGLLQRAGYVVVEATTGREALRRLAALPDVVLLNGNLPDMTGLEVAQRIKGNLSTAHIPVIHHSVTATKAQDQAQALPGAEAYLVHPVPPGWLLSLIEALLRYRDVIHQTLGGYEAVIRGSGLIAFAQDRDLRYTWMLNPSSDFDPFDVVGKRETDVLTAADAAQLELVKRRVLATGQAAREEVMLSVPRGRRSFDLRLEPTFGPSRDILGITCIAADITERKQAEAAAHELDARFRAVWENAADAIVLSDPDGVVIDANPAYCRLYGYPPEQVLGHSFAIVLPEGIRAESIENYRRVFASEEIPPPFVATVQRADLALRQVETKISFVIEAGRRVAMLSFVKDVTGRMQAEDRLARLQGITATLSGALNREQVAATIINQALPVMGADAGNLALLSPDGAEFEMVTSLGLTHDRIGPWLRFPARPGLPMTDVLRLGQLLLIPNKETLRARYPEFAKVATDTSAWALVPLMLEGRGLGAMTLIFNQDHEFSAEDQAMILALGRQCAQALERARLYEIEQQSRAELETRVEQRTAQLREEVERRHEAQRRLETSREAERTRIARELHDELGGLLTGLKMDLRRLMRQPHASPPVAAELSHLAAEVDETVHAVRRIATDLRPALLDDFGIVAALEQHFDDFRQRTGLVGAFDTEADELLLSAERATACFRIVQEALTNVARHAQATRVDVHVGVHAGYAVVRVTDNGRGMDPARQEPGHLGLVGMRERADLVAASLAIETAPGLGTTVLLKMPLEALAP